MIDVVYWLCGDSHDDLVELSKESVRRAYPDLVRFYVYRDEQKEPKMLANVRCQLQHLMSVPWGCRTLFLDADTLVREPLPMFDADMFVTWRDKVNGEESQIVALMPYNYGVVGAYNSPSVLEAWMWMYQRICHMADSYQDWYGNQLALAELVGAPAKAGEKTVHARIRWAYEGRSDAKPITVKQLPCEQYNYTPESLDENVSDKYVLHFKGGRKDLMRQYAQRMGLCTLETTTPT